jgi:hypothetical protein
MRQAGRVFLAWVSLAGLGFVCRAQAPDTASESSPRWELVEQALRRKGTLQPDGAFQFSLPRKDLKVTVAGTPIKPALALGSWIAFSSPGGDSTMAADLVLTENEVAPVMAKLTQAKIEVAALHNHLARESPRVMYMHIVSSGDAVRLADAVRQALALTGTPAESADAGAEKLDLDTEKIERVLGRKGTLKGGTYQFSIPRAETIRDHGVDLPGSLGVATSIKFQPTGGGQAAVTGDFVLVGSEVNPVIEELSAHAIEITALHSHMLTEEPRLFFMHFWANADAVRLARGLRAALDETNSGKPAPASQPSNANVASMAGK